MALYESASEVFAESVRALSKRGWTRSMMSRTAHLCAYSGKGCAIGVLAKIPAQTKAAFDENGGSIGRIAIDFPKEFESIFGGHVTLELLSIMQGAHDSGMTATDMRDNFVRVYNDFRDQLPDLPADVLEAIGASNA